MNRTLLVAALLGSSACGELPDDRPPTMEYVTEAILAPTCGTAECHSSFSRTYGFAFDTVARARQSLVFNSYVTEGDQGNPDTTQLAQIITKGVNIDDPDTLERMPYDAPMPEYDTYLIKKWLASGNNNPLGPEGAQCIPADTGDTTRGCTNTFQVVECDDGDAGAVITDCTTTDKPFCSEGQCVESL